MMARSGRPEDITRPSCGCQTRHGHGIGPQSRRQEMKHLASTGPSLGTGTEPTLPELGHNHADKKLKTWLVLA